MPKYWVYINDFRRFKVEADSPEEAEEIYISGGKIEEDLDFGYANLKVEKIEEDLDFGYANLKVEKIEEGKRRDKQEV